MKKIRVASKTAVEEEGGTWEKAPAEDVIDTMIELGRSSKLVGKGFFDYDENGKRTGLWPGLADTFPVAEEQPPFQDIKDRLTFVMSLDTVRCLEEGVLRTVPDANIGSIFGIGFPPMHGGALQYINGYEAPDGRIGVEAFTERAQELAAEVRLALRPAGPAARQGEERREVRLSGCSGGDLRKRHGRSPAVRRWSVIAPRTSSMAIRVSASEHSSPAFLAGDRQKGRYGKPAPDFLRNEHDEAWNRSEHVVLQYSLPPSPSASRLLPVAPQREPTARIHRPPSPAFHRARPRQSSTKTSPTTSSIGSMIPAHR